MATVDHFMDGGEPHERAEAALMMAHDTLSDPHASDDARAASRRLLDLGLSELTRRLTPRVEAAEDPKPALVVEGGELVVVEESGAAGYTGPLPSVRDVQALEDVAPGAASTFLASAVGTGEAQAPETRLRRWLDKIVPGTPSRSERPSGFYVSGPQMKVWLVSNSSRTPERGLFKGTRVDTLSAKYGKSRRSNDVGAGDRESARSFRRR